MHTCFIIVVVFFVVQFGDFGELLKSSQRGADAVLDMRSSEYILLLE